MIWRSLLRFKRKFWPVYITRFYISKRFCSVFTNKSGEGENHRFVNCRHRKIDYSWQPQAGANWAIQWRQISWGNLRHWVAVSADRNKEKSLQMKGVSMEQQWLLLRTIEDGKLWKLFRILNTTQTSLKEELQARFRLGLHLKLNSVKYTQFYYWLMYGLIRIFVCFHLFYYFYLRIYFKYLMIRFPIYIENP